MPYLSFPLTVHIYFTISNLLFRVNAYSGAIFLTVVHAHADWLCLLAGAVLATLFQVQETNWMNLDSVAFGNSCRIHNEFVQKVVCFLGVGTRCSLFIVFLSHYSNCDFSVALGLLCAVAKLYQLTLCVLHHLLHSDLGFPLSCIWSAFQS